MPFPSPTPLHGAALAGAACLGFAAPASFAEQAPARYQNPIIPGDWSDPPIILVDDTYYSLRSTFGWNPGLHIMESKDLINWRFAGSIVLDRARAGLTTLRNGTSEGGVRGSEINFNPNTAKFQVYAPIRETYRIVAWQADSVAGPWEGPFEVTWGYDPGLFVDDETDADGNRRVWMMTTGGHVFELNADGLSVKGDRLATQIRITDQGSEGPDMFKRNGFYYYVASDGGTRPGQAHDIYTLRAPSITGPWIEDPNNPQMQANADTNARFQGPGHPTVLETPAGEWFVTYHAFEITHYSLGRQALLDPIVWENDWWKPASGSRLPVEQAPRPDLPWTPDYDLQVSDEFTATSNLDLGKQWFWNTQPDYSGSPWNLTDRTGWLRIHTQPGDFDDLSVLPSVILQQLRHKRFDVVTRVDFDATSGNEAAGIVFYHDPGQAFWIASSVVDGVKQIRAGRFFYDATAENHDFVTDEEIREDLWDAEHALGRVVHLKVSVDGDETATLAHAASEHGPWTPLGGRIYFGDSGRDLRDGLEGKPDLGWVGKRGFNDNINNQGPTDHSIVNNRNRWTATAIGLFAMRDGAAEARAADFDYFRVTTLPYVNHPRPVTPNVAAVARYTGEVGGDLTLDLTVNGGVAPFTWSAASLPPGLALDAGTGCLQTGPAGFTAPGNYAATITVRDANNDAHSRSIEFAVGGSASPKPAAKAAR